jgi:hypothetical protein
MNYPAIPDSCQLPMNRQIFLEARTFRPFRCPACKITVIPPRLEPPMFPLSAYGEFTIRIQYACVCGVQLKTVYKGRIEKK